MAKIPVIIDTDPGIDDLVMLLVALTHEDIDVRLITTVAGNQTINKTLENTLRFVSYLEKKVEVAKGLEKPFFKKLDTAEEFQGESGTGNVEFLEANFSASDRSAIVAMREVLLNADEPINVVATGPLTNIGALLLAHPEVKPKIRKISLMGGAAIGGNVTPTAEFNMFTDPDAAEAVFQSGVPIVMSSLDVTRDAFLTNEELEMIRSIGTDLTDKIYAMLKFFQKAAEESPFHAPYFEEVVRIHDLCALAYVINPLLFSGSFYFVTIERCPTFTIGTTVVDYVDSLGKPPNAYVLYEVDRTALVNMLIEAIYKVN